MKQNTLPEQKLNLICAEFVCWIKKPQFWSEYSMVSLVEDFSIHLRLRQLMDVEVETPTCIKLRNHWINLILHNIFWKWIQEAGHGTCILRIWIENEETNLHWWYQLENEASTLLQVNSECGPLRDPISWRVCQTQRTWQRHSEVPYIMSTNPKIRPIKWLSNNQKWISCVSPN